MAAGVQPGAHHLLDGRPAARDGRDHGTDPDALRTGGGAAAAGQPGNLRGPDGDGQLIRADEGWVRRNRWRSTYPGRLQAISSGLRASWRSAIRSSISGPAPLPT